MVNLQEATCENMKVFFCEQEIYEIIIIVNELLSNCIFVLWSRSNSVATSEHGY